ncbi:MAG TPA: malto-oligosyltrehalose trehalohydrolase, partial [Dehalococcoidia bacterium]|nr:malto-oligosyltrehalose trehalohydrolase [Dehalococcoidia bacterium]
MTAFRVWAPFAGSVELALRDRALTMRRGGDGWWDVDVPGLDAGADYAYLVDGDGPFPDPRSPWQPNGVHDWSRTLDHDAFAWQTNDWPQTPLSEAVIYELHIGTFTEGGTFDSAMER